MPDFDRLNRLTRETLRKAWSQSAVAASAAARRRPEAEEAPGREKKILATGKPVDEPPEPDDTEEVPEKGAGARRGSVSKI